MIYTRLEYAILLLLTWVIYMLWRGRSGRIHLLIAASLFFYGWAGAFDLGVFLAVIVFAYSTTVLAHLFPRRKLIFIGTGIVVLAGHLLFWKYLPWAGRGAGVEIWLPLPLGISFFTLQGIGYLVDYYRGQSEKMSFREFVLFKSFFPQLIAGPIVRAGDMWTFLRNLPSPKLDQVVEGLFLIGLGLVKKVIIADYLGIFVDGIFANPGELDRATLILGAVTICSFPITPAFTRRKMSIRPPSLSSMNRVFLNRVLYASVALGSAHTRYAGMPHCPATSRMSLG